MSLKALIFDVDGTLANTERYGHLRAFNLAFEQSNLDWVWSNELYFDLLEVAGGKERIKYYLNTYNKTFAHNDLDGFIKDIHKLKTKNYVHLMKQGNVPLRTGVKKLIIEANEARLRLAIATTTTPINVEALISSTLGEGFLSKFEIIGAGDIVKNKKPAPDIYNLVLRKMNLKPEQCLAFEDSENGIISATKAGLKTIITTNEYTKEHKFDNALAVFDNLDNINLKKIKKLYAKNH